MTRGFPPIRLRVYYQRPSGLPVRGSRGRMRTCRSRPLHDGRALEPGDRVQFSCPFGRMVLLCEDRAQHRVLRCHEFFLHRRVPRGAGHGTRLHRAIEDHVASELGLVFCTANDATVEGNATTSAMRDRVLALYPDSVRIGDASVLLGKRLEPAP